MGRQQDIRDKLNEMIALRGEQHEVRVETARALQSESKYASETDTLKRVRMLAQLTAPASRSELLEAWSWLRADGTTPDATTAADLWNLEQTGSRAIAAMAVDIFERHYASEASIKARIDVEIAKDAADVDPARLARLLRRAMMFEDLDT